MSSDTPPPFDQAPNPEEQPPQENRAGEVFAIIEDEEARFGMEMPNGDRHITELPTKMLYALGQAIAGAFTEAGAPPPQQPGNMPPNLASLQFCSDVLRSVIAQAGGSIPVHYQYLNLPLQQQQVLALPAFDGSGVILYLNPGPPHFVNPPTPPPAAS